MRSARKEKRTFSLSAESVAYLKVVARKYKSISEALDELIRGKMLEARKQRISAGIRSYYDSRPDWEREEDRRWGQFAESQFPE